MNGSTSRCCDSLAATALIHVTDTPRRRSALSAAARRASSPPSATPRMQTFRTPFAVASSNSGRRRLLTPATSASPSSPFSAIAAATAYSVQP